MQNISKQSLDVYKIHGLFLYLIIFLAYHMVFILFLCLEKKIINRLITTFKLHLVCPSGRKMMSLGNVFHFWRSVITAQRLPSHGLDWFGWYRGKKKKFWFLFKSSKYTYTNHPLCDLLRMNGTPRFYIAKPWNLVTWNQRMNKRTYIPLSFFCLTEETSHFPATFSTIA